MCGVIGLVYAQPREDLGRIAGELLKTLEYRGYDSTGAAIQDAGDAVTLLKGVGAPSVMADKLGITSLSGRILCGQVRWATFGAVDNANAQPHEVGCKVALYGAHNGNVTNCDGLKQWLLDEGHDVKSDNDGEMVVHTIEHLFAKRLQEAGTAVADDPELRRDLMRRAIAAASDRLEGSFAAVIVDPRTRTLWAIKHGSSLYCGVGEDERGQPFGIASSDLSSVLKLTRIMVPLVEGEFVEIKERDWDVYGIRHGDAGHDGTAEYDGAWPDKLERTPVRSRLHASDIALQPGYDYFMDQEIAAQEDTVRSVVRMMSGGGRFTRAITPLLDDVTGADAEAILGRIDSLRGRFADQDLRLEMHALIDDPAFQRLLGRLPDGLCAECEGPVEILAELLGSDEAGLFADLLAMARDTRDRLAVRVFDAIVERADSRAYTASLDQLLAACLDGIRVGRRLLVICCGSSYNAALAAAVFFNRIARAELIPVLPGEFRGRINRTLRDGDVVLAVSQSGETKDLIDVMNDVIASGKTITRVALVNNVNSTLAQEKSDVVIPLRCGPEVAVPATKSFINQVAVFYGLACRLAARRGEAGDLTDAEEAATIAEGRDRMERFGEVPDLLRATLASTDADIELASHLLYLRPSMHILATRINAVAKEGALKIREVVLNHTEGFEGSEFKHGPNTILGQNTVFGPTQLHRLIELTGDIVDAVIRTGEQKGMTNGSLRRLAQAVSDTPFAPEGTFTLSDRERTLLDKELDREELLGTLYEDYPLIYVCGPDSRDVALTVSQLNTHKIRGATTVVIAEENAALRNAAARPPADNPEYRHVYITLPRTNDTMMTVFTSILVLQRLALRMSVMKAAYLDRLGFIGHGVHPDVPKNVSKSITVD